MLESGLEDHHPAAACWATEAGRGCRVKGANVITSDLLAECLWRKAAAHKESQYSPLCSDRRVFIPHACVIKTLVATQSQQFRLLPLQEMCIYPYDVAYLWFPIYLMQEVGKVQQTSSIISDSLTLCPWNLDVKQILVLFWKCDFLRERCFRWGNIFSDLR